MNCKNFEAIISDLAREQMLEAAVRQSTLSHVEECQACASLLEAERALTRGFQALAASSEERNAPAHIEANLLTKFRERKAMGNSPVVIQMPQRASRFNSWYPQVAAAAVLLMFAIGGGALALRIRQGQVPDAQPSASASKSSRTESGPTPASAAPLAPSVVDNTDGVQSTAAATTDSSKDREHGQKLSRSEVAALFGSTPRRSGSVAAKSGVAESRMASTSAEIATDFMPVAYGDNLNSIDSGRIVRVEMPRSALAQFGLPVNMERANERIKADVLIGEDGMARAIRFVR